jgi:hypothetical protein
MLPLYHEADQGARVSLDVHADENDSNHQGTHLDGEIHTFTAGKDMADLELNGFLAGPAAVVDLSDATDDCQIYTPEMIEEWVEVREGDILIIHTGQHHFGWDQPYADHRVRTGSDLRPRADQQGSATSQRGGLDFPVEDDILQI